MLVEKGPTQWFCFANEWKWDKDQDAILLARSRGVDCCLSSDGHLAGRMAVVEYARGRRRAPARSLYGAERRSGVEGMGRRGEA